MIFGSDRRKRQNSAIWQKKFMFEKKSRGITQGTKEVHAGYPLLGNDKRVLWLINYLVIFSV